MMSEVDIRDISLINGFNTYEEADKHRMKVENPDDYGIISIHAKDLTTALYHITTKKILKEFIK